MQENVIGGGFGKRLKSMLKVDARRILISPALWIMLGVSLALPVLVLVMTSSFGGSAPSEAGAETVETFTNVWQAIGASSGSAMSMDLASMCNINLIYFLSSVLVCLFVGEDFRSGFAKNLFAVRPKKSDYVISKTVVLFAATAGMFALYFVGAMIGGGIAGLSFDLSEMGASAASVAACMVGKVFFALVFVAIALTLSAVGKQKLWLSILGSFAAGMLLFAMIPMMTPLDSGAFNVILCAFGGPIFAAGLGAATNAILNKTSLA